MGLSQSDRILLCLMQGDWWTTAELLREVPSIVHSRVSDLRARGLTIEHRTTGVGAAGSEYRLVALGPVEELKTGDTAAPVGEPSAGPSTASAPLGTGEPRRSIPATVRGIGELSPPSDARPLASSPVPSGGRPLAAPAGPAGLDILLGESPRSPSAADSPQAQLPLLGDAA